MNDGLMDNIGFFIVAFLVGLVIGLIFWFASRQRAKNLTIDLEVLSKKLLTKEEEAAEAISKLEALETENADLSLEFNTLKSDLDSKQREISRLISTPKVVDNSAKWKAEIETKDKELSTLKAGLLKSNDQRKAAIAKLKEMKETFESKVNPSFDDKAFKGLAETQLKKLKADNESLRAQNQRLDVKLRDMVAQISLLRGQPS